MEVEFSSWRIITNGYIWFLHQKIDILLDNRSSCPCNTTWRISLPTNIFDFIPEWPSSHIAMSPWIRSRFCKVGCIFLIVGVSMLPHAEIGRNDHYEGAPHFINSFWNSTDLYFHEWKSLLHIRTEMSHNYIHQYSKISWFGRIHSLQLLVPCKWKNCNSRPYGYTIGYQHWNNHPSLFDILSLWASSIINYSLRIILRQP